MPTLTIPSHRNGPPSSGNGGWTAGSLAAALSPTDPATPVTVKLFLPPPLDRPLDVRHADSGLDLVDDADRRVAAAQHTTDDITPVPAVAEAVATAAHERFRGLADHPFPTCYVCGLNRADGSGMRLQPGPLPDAPEVTACTWQVPTDEPVDVPLLWAALDCPGGWSVDLSGRPMVLGTMTAAVHAFPDPGTTCVVTGRCDRADGKKAFTSTSVWAGDQLCAQASAVWIAVDPETFNKLAR